MKTMKIRFYYISMCIIFLFATVTPVSLFANANETQQQAVIVTGKVTDPAGDLLPGVRVTVKGTSIGTVTSANGEYSIGAPSTNATLVFNYLGYSSIEEAIGGRTSINIQMSENTQILDEVVVVGYGTQKKIHLTGSVSAVGSDKIANRPAMNFSTSLAGLAPGVRVSQGSGNPGSESVSINIRGTGSVNGGSPMVLVDGIVSDMSVLNSDDVESVSFLKDAASSAIYGSRAANGVVLVTTKKGKKAAPRVTFSAMIAQEKAVTNLKFLSSTADFLTLHNVAANNNNPGGTGRYQQSIIDEWRAADANPNGIYTHPVTGTETPNWLAFPNTDWATEMFQAQYYHRYNLSVSGGTDNSTYLLSGSFQENPGSLENTALQRFNVRANVESKVNDFITVGTQTWATKEFKEPGDVSMTYLSQSAPSINPKHNGFYGTSEESSLSQMNNPLHSIASAGGQREFTRINSTWYVNAKIWDGLSAEAKFNYNEYQRQDATHSQDIPRYRFREGMEYPVRELTLENATTSRYSFFNASYTANFFLKYMRSFGDHDIDAFVAYEQYYYKRSGFQAVRKGLLDWNITDILSAAEMQSIGGNADNDPKQIVGMLSYFGRINYAYKDKYLLGVNVRSDASSRYAPGYRWGTFPSFSAGWRISEEDFFAPAKPYIDNLKLKASYGVLGNQISGYYDWQSTYGKVNNVFDERVQNGVIQAQLPNFMLTWEKTATTNVGFEANFLRQRLSLEMDYYVRNTWDMLVRPPQYITVGNVNSPRTNDGEMKNSGIDLSIGWNDKIGDFRYSAGLNFNYNTNEITKYKGQLKYELDESVLDIWGNPTWRYTNLGDVMATESNNRVVEGRKVNEHFLRRPYNGDGTYMNADGTPNPNGGPKDGMIRSKADLEWVRAMMKAGYSFNSKTVNHGAANLWYGEMLYADANGDGRYGNDDDREFTGKTPAPKFTFGLNLSAEWKGFDMSMSWAGRLGSYHHILQRGVNHSLSTTPGDAFNGDAFNMYYSYDAYAARYDHDNYDPALDPNANFTGKYPRLVSATSTIVDNTFYLYNTSYLKLKSLQIGYTIPKSILQPAKINNLRVFVTGENLLTIMAKDFPAVDPELGGGIAVYPIARMISGGVTITF